MDIFPICQLVNILQMLHMPTPHVISSVWRFENRVDCVRRLYSWFLKCQTSFPFPKGYLGTSLESKKLGINGGYGVLHILGHSLNPIKMHACSIFEKAFPATA